MSYRVLIVEDQNMPRQLMEIFINNSEDYELVASIANAELALGICERRKVDLILMDVMTEFNNSGLDAAEEIKSKYPRIKIIIVTSMPEYSWLDRAREIGVDSFWYKESGEHSILTVMDRTMAGEMVYPLETPLVQIGLSDNHSFTERELEILRELITGDSNVEIGERLGISTGTVKWHINSLLQKTGFHTRTELAAVARSLGIVIKM